MHVPFWRSVYSEWLKQRRSMAGRLVVGGGLLVPAVLLAVRLRQRSELPALYASEVFWEQLWNQAWESLAVLFLPLGVIILTSLVTQIEHRHNGWKQVHATPQSDFAVFSAKLCVVLVLLLQLFVVLNAGLWIVGMLPPLMFEELALPAESFPLDAFAARSLDYYVDVLPIVALQFLLGLRARNVLLPVGVGMGIWTVATVGISWKYNYVLLYGYAAMDFFAETGARVGRALPADMSVVALVACGVTTAAGYALFATRAERG